MDDRDMARLSHIVLGVVIGAAAVSGLMLLALWWR